MSTPHAHADRLDSYRRRPPARFRRLGLAGVLAAFFAGDALADKGECGQPFSNGGNPSTNDSLYILKGAVQLVPCFLCECDLNDSGTVTSGDSLIDLKGVVGQEVDFECPPCDTTTTTSTTTTEQQGCATPFSALDGVVFNEKYSCRQAFTGQSYQCVDSNVQDKIKFKHLGGGQFEIRDEPDNGFVYNGSFADCNEFNWTAIYPGEYSETGMWVFNDALTTFSGASAYTADLGTYAGQCEETGARFPTTPPNTPPITPCP